MSDSSDERPRDNFFSRAILARIIAVVLFILLGTATVVYLVKYQKTAETPTDKADLALEIDSEANSDTTDDLPFGNRSPASLYATTPASLEEPADSDTSFNNRPTAVAASFPPSRNFEQSTNHSGSTPQNSAEDDFGNRSNSPMATNNRFNDLPSFNRPTSTEETVDEQKQPSNQPPSFTAPDRFAANFGGSTSGSTKPFIPLPDNDRSEGNSRDNDFGSPAGKPSNREEFAGNSSSHPFQAAVNKPQDAPTTNSNPGNNNADGFNPGGFNPSTAGNPRSRDLPKTIPDLPSQINSFPGAEKPKLKAPSPNAVPQDPPPPFDAVKTMAAPDSLGGNINSENESGQRTLGNELDNQSPGFTGNPLSTNRRLEQPSNGVSVVDNNPGRTPGNLANFPSADQPLSANSNPPSTTPITSPMAAPLPREEPQPLRTATNQTLTSPIANRQSLINAPHATSNGDGDGSGSGSGNSNSNGENNRSGERASLQNASISNSGIRTAALPGEKQLEGVQAPSLTVEKLAPREITLHETANFEIVIRNVGRVDADQVQIQDRVPVNTRFEGSTPEPSRITDDGQILWDLGGLAVGREARIQYRLQPTAPGEIGSVAQVTFATQAAMRTRVTQPQLEISHRSNPIVMIGGDVILDVVVTNRGDGVARNVLIQEDVPQQLEFREGFRELEYEVGSLAPGQSRRIQLPLKAVKVGKLKNRIIAVAEGDQRVQHEIDIEVVSPAIKLSLDGPSRRFLNRQAVHTLTIANQGTAAATNVELVAKLPSGLKFVSANNQGRYVPQRHAVFWSMAHLPTGLDGQVELATMPTEIGQQNIQFEIAADQGIKDSETQQLVVEHVADLYFDIKNLIDPIEVGAETAYQIRLVNQGTIVAENVRLSAEFANGLSPGSVEGNLPHQISGQTVQFAPITSLKPGEQLQVIVRARGQAPGDHRVVLKLETDGRQATVTKEAATQVYADR